MADPVSEREPIEELAESFLARFRAGERPPLSELVAAHPELTEEIRALFPALIEMEQAGSAIGPTPGWAASRAPLGGTPLESLGDYRIIREIGRGGMGVVYEAVQESLGRHVALKVFAPWAPTDRKMIERFQREAKAAARLHHTNIVPVFGVGEHNSYRYYVMQFIQGQGLDAILGELRRLRSAPALGPGSLTGQEVTDPAPLATTVARSLLTGHFSDPAREPRTGQTRAGGSEIDYELFDPLPAPALTGGEVSSDASHWASQPGGSYARIIARVGLQVAEALAHAHGQGILHRDIKPSNLLLDIAGNVWVTDFGLAKADDAGNLTESGEVVGTARYMAPERFRGESGPESDVYGLGVTLYELLTLRPAFDERDRARLIDHILHTDPPALRAVDPRIPRDLETIVLKAMAKEPARRYATAGEMADDLRRFLADRPIRARRTPWHERGWRWCRRNPMPATLFGCVAALVLFIAGSIGWMARDRAALDAALDRQVETILVEAGSLIEEANWPKAMSAVERAEKLLEAASRREVPEHLRDLKGDLAMVGRLQSIYPEAKTAQHSSHEEHFWGREQDAEFARAFHQFGIDLNSQEPAESAGWIGGRSIGQALVKALDEWAAARRRTHGNNDPGWRRLVEVARHADPDSWRNRCREALLSDDRHALEQLAAMVPIRQVPPPTLWLLGMTLQELGARDNAMALLRRAQHEYPDDEWLNDTLGWFSTTKFDPPRYDDALRFYTAALALHPRLARHHAAVAGALLGKGAAEEAWVEFTKAIELDPKNPSLWITRGNALARSGQHAKAVLDFTSAIELDPHHPATLHAMALLARSQAELGRHDEAKRLREETLALRKGRLGPRHPDTLTSMGDLGLSYRALGRHAEALKLFEETLALRKAVLGLDHPHTLWTMANLAVSQAESGRDAEALKLREETLALRKAKLGPRHPDTLTSMEDLGLSYLDMGRDAEALKLFQETLALRKAVRGLDHPDTLGTMANLAVSQAALGRHAEALKLREEILSRRRAKLGLDHIDTLKSQMAVASSLLWVGRCAEAAALARQAAAQWDRRDDTDPYWLFCAAFYRAIAAAAVRAADPSAEGAKQASAEADRAMAWLEKAVAAGSSDVIRMEADPNLDAIRDRADFKALVGKLKSRKNDDTAR
jgi:serine/threonine protein kinase